MFPQRQMASEGDLTAERPVPVSHKLGYRHDATLTPTLMRPKHEGSSRS